jgi:hypothetical protein
MRFLIQHYYLKQLEIKEINAQDEIQKDQGIIKKFISNFGSDWKKLGE